MTQQALARAAYADASTHVRTPRGAEFEAFARVTRQLKVEAKRRGARMTASLAEALYENRRLWTILASDVAGADNQLPPPLRAQIFYLAEFTHQHSSKVLRRQAPIKPLLEINLAILRGLREGKQGT